MCSALAVCGTNAKAWRSDLPNMAGTKSDVLATLPRKVRLVRVLPCGAAPHDVTRLRAAVEGCGSEETRGLLLTAFQDAGLAKLPELVRSAPASEGPAYYGAHLQE